MAANPHETTPIFPTTRDHRDEAEHGCFRSWPCFGRRDDDDSHSYLLRENNGSPGGPHKEAWFVSNLKKLREFSEVVAGPRWKNFIRKISKMGRRGNNNSSNNVKPAAAQFQYTPESYALNFAGGDREEDADLLHSFSTRFAPPGFSGNEQRRRGDNM